MEAMKQKGGETVAAVEPKSGAADAPSKPPLVAPDRAKAIIEFGKDLARLCKKYGLEIYGSPDATSTIEVLDLKRKTPMPKNYGYDAQFQGCDPTGIYSDDGAEKTYQPIEIEAWMPEDLDEQG